jgi:signal transduction histidine kinase
MTAIVLAIWVHRSIMNPLKQLGDATKRIAEGDLDFTLQAKTQDEFGALCDDFENMRKRLKESAEDKIRDDEESKELISNISHDLKTPITAIKGYVEGIMDGVADTPEKMEKYIKTIYNKANDMDKLIGELTVYSQIDTNRIPYNFKKVNVDDYFSDCVEEISVELEAKNIRLNYFNYVDKDTIIIADPEQLKRVVNNIISNSVKYIGNKQGALNIRINDDNDFVHVEIEDNGKGIQAKDLPYIFDRFYRTDSSRNSNQGGSGIGLAIAKKIIEVHGGKIWATSKVDTGTIMHFIIRKYVTTQNNVQA